MPNLRQPECALDLASAILGRRWVLLVLREILHRPKRFSELHKRLPWIPAKSLARVLQNLEKDGLVERNVNDKRPPEVSYSLAHEDALLSQAIESLSSWGKQNFKRFS